MAHSSSYPWQHRQTYQKPRNPRAALNIWLAMAAAIAVIMLCTGTLSSGHTGGLPSLTFATLLSVLQDIFSSLLFSTAALLAMLYAVTRMLPGQAASAQNTSRGSNTSSQTDSRTYGAYKSPFPASGHAGPAAGQNGRTGGPTPGQTFRQPSQQTYQQSRRPLPPAPAAPSSLVQHAETLLTRARTIPNFTTTPLAGQHRVLTKLAANFVPPAQRHAAVTLAVFRLRQPASTPAKAA